MSSKKYPNLLQDKKYPEMYRVEWAKGDISDMVNKTRAKDAIVRYLETEPRTERRMAGRSH